MAAAFDWANFAGFQFSFLTDSSHKFHAQQTTLNINYATYLSALDKLFVTNQGARIVLAANPIPVIKKLIIDDIVSSIHRLNDDAREEERTTLGQLLDDSIISAYDNDGPKRIRSATNLTTAAQAMHEQGKRTMDLRVNINHWCFRRRWQFYSFSRIYFKDHEAPSDSDDDSSKSTSTAPATNGVDDKLTKILEEQQKLIADLAQRTNSTPPSQANVNQVGQQLPISDLHWNSNELPNPVLPRFNVRKTYLSHKQMEPFAIENKDANGIVISTVDMNHYLHTKRGTNLQKLITRSGDCFDLSPLDDNKKVFEKQFLSGFPQLDGEEAAEVRKWYRAIVGRAKQYHMYIHPYYNFRRDVNHNRGFTLGDNFPDDVPQRYNTAIDEWGTLLLKALCQDKVIPDSCATMKATVQNYEDGNGYEALWGVIKSTHPHHLRSYETNKLVRSYPQQQEGERIEHYYFRFNDHLQLKSYLRHPCSLDDPQEISALIGGCINRIELEHRSKYERENPHHLHKYTSGNILGTLQTFETEIEFEKKQKRAERPRRSIPPTISRRTTTSRFSKLSRYSSYRTASTATSSITTQSVNLIDSIGLPEEDITVLPDIWDAYICAIKTLERNPREFDISRKYLICGETGHAFANCPFLLKA